MDKFKRTTLAQKYHRITLHEYDINIILYAAGFGNQHVTIENFYHYGRSLGDFEFTLRYKDVKIQQPLKRFNIDFDISNTEFSALGDLWNEQGCNAVFHHKPGLKFQANELPENKRYHALNNYEWNLEIIVPGSGSSGEAHVTSPEKWIIDKIEEQLALYLNQH